MITANEQDTRVEITTQAFHLADDEWGNELMASVASAAFRANTALDIVTVYEHGGWSLQYIADSPSLELTIVGTANDMAVLSDKAAEFRQTLNDIRHSNGIIWTYLPDVWRRDMPKRRYYVSDNGFNRQYCPDMIGRVLDVCPNRYDVSVDIVNEWDDSEGDDSK